MAPVTSLKPDKILQPITLPSNLKANESPTEVLIHVSHYSQLIFAGLKVDTRSEISTTHCDAESGLVPNYVTPQKEFQFVSFVIEPSKKIVNSMKKRDKNKPMIDEKVI
jgi:hypothetical protein